MLNRVNGLPAGSIVGVPKSRLDSALRGVDDHSDHPTMCCHHEMEARDVRKDSMAPPGWSGCDAVSAFDQAPVINRVETFSWEFVAFVRVSAHWPVWQR